MIKVIFKDEAELNSAITNKFSIFHKKYVIEPFSHKPRVIKCNICQRFGHVSRICRAKNKPVCEKSCQGHETKDCNAKKEEYKCFHCGKSDHITGQYNCEKMKEKLQILTERRENGQ